MPNLASRLFARDPNESGRVALPLELFFDLVFVIAIATLTASFHHAISHAHGVEKIGSFIFVFVAIWWAWMNYTWFASAFGNDRAFFRIMSFVIMGGAVLFAAGVGQIFENGDFSYGLVGWIIMRLGMVGLWLRAAEANPELRQTCLRYATGLVIAQALWVLMYFTTDPASDWWVPIGIAIFLVEFSVPVVAERAGTTPFHRHHIMEGYGLLNIIVLGEVLLSISFALRELFTHGFDNALVLAGLSGFLIVAALYWLYFCDEEHLPQKDFGGTFLWGYGHIAIFGAVAAIGAGLAAELDVITHHSEITIAEVSAFISVPMALYLVGLWAYAALAVLTVIWRVSTSTEGQSA